MAQSKCMSIGNSARHGCGVAGLRCLWRPCPDDSIGSKSRRHRSIHMAAFHRRIELGCGISLNYDLFLPAHLLCVTRVFVYNDTMAAQETLLNGRYRLITQQGSGGMAVIYKAQDIALGRIVAVKVLRPSLTGDPTFLTRFRQEARNVANLAHP